MKTSALGKKPVPNQEQVPAFKFLFIIGFCHLLNDTLQSVVPAMFPILQAEMHLSYTQVGFIAFALNIVSSLMQPVVGWYTDKKPMPYALPVGLFSSMIGMIMLAIAPSYAWIILSVILIGIGSAIFHPEGSRVAFMAAGTKRGLAQSIYQVGGNTGQALAPLITAFVLIPLGQLGGLTFAPVALLASLLLLYIAGWYRSQMNHLPANKQKREQENRNTLSATIKKSLLIILFIIFARSFYIAAMTSFFAFFLLEQYGFTLKAAQITVFIFLAAGAIGTFFGGPLADRFGKKTIIVLSMVVSAPLTVILPYMEPVVASFLLFVIGITLMSSFSVTVVYAQELVPGKIGTMAGLTVGLAFGMGAVGSVAIGNLADAIGLITTIKICGYLPLLGFLAFLLPSDQQVAFMQKG
ncbi:MAG: MFS transporter [Bacillus sp. (in: firmicutes)]